MRILMTGATGLIGRELGKALVARGDALVCLVRDVGAARRRLADSAKLLAGRPARLRTVLVRRPSNARWPSGRCRAMSGF